MEKIINKLINEFVKGVDIYKTDGGSIWLIFTDNKQWVIELNEHNTLWYNYNFFKNIFNYVSMDVVENQDYITKWVENYVINDVNYTTWGPEMNSLFVDGVLENGIKETKSYDLNNDFDTNEVIKTGVKETESWDDSINGELNQNGLIDIVIRDGIKETKYNQSFQEPKFKEVLKNKIIMSNPRQYVTNKILDDTIETGVKKTQGTPNWTHDQKVSNVIDNGVKETHDDAYHHKDRIDGVIKYGVKETELHKGNRRFATNYAIKRGVKETKTPGAGDIVSTIEWMNENKSTSYTKMIDDVIENGVKETKPMDEWVNTKNIVGKVIDNGIKETKGDSSQNPMGKVDKVIDNGVKETKACYYKDPKTNLMFIKWDYQIDNVIETGIKEVQPLPSQEGNKDWGIYYHGKEDRTKPHTEYVDEVIKTAIKYE